MQAAKVSQPQTDPQVETQTRAGSKGNTTPNRPASGNTNTCRQQRYHNPKPTRMKKHAQTKGDNQCLTLALICIVYVCYV